LSSLDPTALLLGSFKEAGSIARVQSKRKGSIRYITCF
jgi:hypothetical protein